MNRDQVRLCIEGGVTGLAYSSGLVALSVFLVGSFRPQELPNPYVSHLEWLRTDTCGIVSFGVATIALAISDYLRRANVVTSRLSNVIRVPGTIILLITVVARSLVAAGTTLVIYISINSVTHPITLELPATHLLSWPTEGTLRAVSLVVVVIAVATCRALHYPEKRK